MAQPRIIGASTKGTDKVFQARVIAAAAAKGATVIDVISAKRTPQTNTGVSNSNHLYGHAWDARAFVPGEGWVPLGTLLKDDAGSFGLRSGDQPGFYKNQPDPNHVDDGYNVNGNVPLPGPDGGTQTAPPAAPPTQQPVPDVPVADASTVDEAAPSFVRTLGPRSVGFPGSGGYEDIYTDPKVSTWQTIASGGYSSPESQRIASILNPNG